MLSCLNFLLFLKKVLPVKKSDIQKKMEKKRKMDRHRTKRFVSDDENVNKWIQKRTVFLKLFYERDFERINLGKKNNIFIYVNFTKKIISFFFMC